MGEFQTTIFRKHNLFRHLSFSKEIPLLYTLVVDHKIPLGHQVSLIRSAMTKSPCPYGYLGQLVLFYIFVNLSSYYYCIMLGTNKVVVVVVVVVVGI